MARHSYEHIRGRDGKVRVVKSGRGSTEEPTVIKDGPARIFRKK